MQVNSLLSLRNSERNITNGPPERVQYITEYRWSIIMVPVHHILQMVHHNGSSTSQNTDGSPEWVKDITEYRWFTRMGQGHPIIKWSIKVPVHVPPRLQMVDQNGSSPT